eukprot:5683577-Ditylum_brightwellii.AAC.1
MNYMEDAFPTSYISDDSNNINGIVKRKRKYTWVVLLESDEELSFVTVDEMMSDGKICLRIAKSEK